MSAALHAVDKVCIVGAGGSGLAACQVLHARGIDFDCYEKGSSIGGNWRYGNDNEMSSAYESLFVNTSRATTGYAAYPMPESYPDYPHHTQIAAYFDDYVDHFGFRDRIRFRTEVVRIEPAPDDGWNVTVRLPTEGERKVRYSAVVIASGHHWDPRWPEPPFPGSDEFAGEQMHSHLYRSSDVLTDKRVLVLGIGNSAADIAVESAREGAKTFLAMRRGAHVLPKFLDGKPIEALQRYRIPKMLAEVVGEMTDYGLPEPDHELFDAHPTVSSELLPCLDRGDIGVKPNIDRFTGGNTVRFIDGSTEEVDLVVYCTGYRITFPFLDPTVFSAPDNRMELYARVVSVENPGLFFIGFIQPLGPIMPLAEAQSEWVADLLGGQAALPPEAAMREEIARYERRSSQRFVPSKRHTIQVEFHAYLRQLRLARKRSSSVSRQMAT